MPVRPGRVCEKLGDLANFSINHQHDCRSANACESDVCNVSNIAEVAQLDQVQIWQMYSRYETFKLAQGIRVFFSSRIRRIVAYDCIKQERKKKRFTGPTASGDEQTAYP